jgi:hypothetical protein
MKSPGPSLRVERQPERKFYADTLGTAKGKPEGDELGNLPRKNTEFHGEL